MSWRIRLVTGVLATLAMLLFGGIVIGCAPSEEKTDARTESETIALEPNEGAAEPAATESDGPLAGTEWHLVEIQSLDDDVGSVRPHDPTLYTLSLGADGTVQMRLNCNRATGTWFSEPSGDESSGRLEFGPLAATRALCAPPSLDERIVADAGFVRSYLLQDGRLHLSLMADGGIYGASSHVGDGGLAGFWWAW
jgi:heat shock protein HslJ